MNAASTPFGAGSCPYCGVRLTDSSVLRVCEGCMLMGVQPLPPRIVNALPPPDTSECAKRLARECQALAQLRSTFVPAFHYKAEVGDIHYLVMDWIDGGTLEHCLVPGEPCPLRDVVRWMDQLCDALAFAHARDWIHRDVKPGNILIDRHTLRLSDFGTARHRVVDSGLTQMGVCLGTPSYMAPEQAEGRLVDTRADIYSAAVVFYHLLTGDEPKGRFMPLPSETPGVPSVFDEIVKKATQNDPDKRHTTIEDLRGDIDKAWDRYHGRCWAALMSGLERSRMLLRARFNSL